MQCNEEMLLLPLKLLFRERKDIEYCICDQLFLWFNVRLHFFWRFEFNFSFEFQIRMYYFLQIQPFPTFSTFLWSRNAQLIKISQEYRLLFQFFEAIKFVHDYVAKSIAYFFY